MDQVQDNPSIMCIGCSEDSVALKIIERIIVHVWGNQVNHVTSNGTWHMWRNDIVATNHMIGASNPRIECNTQGIYVMRHGNVAIVCESNILNIVQMMQATHEVWSTISKLKKDVPWKRVLVHSSQCRSGRKCGVKVSHGRMYEALSQELEWSTHVK